MAEKWFSVSVADERMTEVPYDVLQKRKCAIELLEKENEELNEALNEKSSVVLELLCKGLENERRIKELEQASNV